MKKLIILILIFTACNLPPLIAQNASWSWARGTGGPQPSGGNSTATDSNGNIVVTGGFTSDSIVFDNDTLWNPNPITGSTETLAFFVVKYDPGGHVLWAKSAIGNSTNYGMSLVIDHNDDIIVAGLLIGDSLTFGTTTIFNNAPQSIFIVKYDPNGNAIWATSTAGNYKSSLTLSKGLCIDRSDNIFITGYFQDDSISFGSITLYNYIVHSHLSNIFIAKYNSSGAAVWATSAGGNKDDFGTSVTADTSGSFIVTGYFKSDSITLGSIVFHNTGSADIYIIKFDSSGNMVWNRLFGNTSDTYANAVASDASGNVFVTGYFTAANMFFGTIILNGGTYYILKLNSSGQVQWANTLWSGYTDFGQNLTTDMESNVYVTGAFFTGIVYFDTIPVINTYGSTSQAVFVVKYDAFGNVIWANGVHSNGPNAGVISEGITVDQGGNCYVTGSFGRYPALFNNISLNNLGDGNFFLGKISDTPNGISVVAKEKNLDVYPNPCYDYLKVENINPGANIKIFNVLNKIVFDNNSNDISARIDISYLSPGIYFLKVDGFEMCKFVKVSN